MRCSRGTFFTLAAVALLAITGCDDPLSPCEVESFVNDSDFLDGKWNAERINGSLIPQAGFKADNDDFIKAVTMEFHTFKVAGGCLTPTEMSGAVVVRYKLVDQIGFPKDSKSYSALFEYNVKPREIFFRVDTERANGARTTPQLLTVNPITPDGWTPMTITFTR